jgi:hypothetical protein
MNEPATALTDRLAELAQRANHHHAQCDLYSNEGALREAIEAGLALIDAKEQVPVGTWLTWLQQNTRIPERTARTYMDVARDSMTATPVAGPSVRKALLQLAAKRPPKPPSNVVQLQFVGPPPRPAVSRTPDQTGKGRARANRRNPRAPKPRQPAFVEAPKFFEDFLTALELCTSEYELPAIPPVLRTLMKQRIGRAKVDEMIAYLQRVAAAMEE